MNLTLLDEKPLLDCLRGQRERKHLSGGIYSNLRQAQLLFVTSQRVGLYCGVFYDTFIVKGEQHEQRSFIHMFHSPIQLCVFLFVCFPVTSSTATSMSSLWHCARWPAWDQQRCAEIWHRRSTGCCEPPTPT